MPPPDTPRSCAGGDLAHFAVEDSTLDSGDVARRLVLTPNPEFTL